MRSLAATFVLLLPVLAFAQTAADDEQRARELVVAGKVDEAIPIYERLVRAAPGDPRMLVNLAIAEFKARRFESAASHAAAALKAAPALHVAGLFLGASYLELGRYDDAVPRLESFVAAVPGDRNARLMLAEALLGAERYQQALEHFRKSAESLPDSPRVWYGLGRTYTALAESAVSELQRRGPESAYADAVAADAYLEKNRYGSAFEAYRRALSRGVAIAGVYAGLARVYRETGHADWAAVAEARERQAGVAGEPDSPGASEYRAYRSYRQLAREAFDRLRRLPPSTESHIHAARELDAAGQHVKAAAEWREALKAAPEKEQIQSALAWALYRSRDHEAVLPLIAAQLARQPDSAQANFLYGASLVNIEKPQDAIPYLRRALAASPDFRPAQAALGQALLRTGRAEDAIPHLNAAVVSDETGSVRFQLFRAYQVTGQAQLAKSALAEYQRVRAEIEADAKKEQGGNITGPIP
jgi:predicted Zn-dependent protease